MTALGAKCSAVGVFGIPAEEILDLASTLIRADCLQEQECWNAMRRIRVSLGFRSRSDGSAIMGSVEREARRSSLQTIVVGPGVEALLAPILLCDRRTTRIHSFLAFSEYGRVCGHRGIERVGESEA